MSREDRQKEEILRLLNCKRTKADQFIILGVDPGSCEISDIEKAYRKLSLLVHPDKCALPNGKDAFSILDNAKKSIPDEGVLQKLKIAHKRRMEKAEEESRRRAQRGAGGIGGGGETDEQRRARLREEHRYERVLEAARLGDMDAEKKARNEAKVKDDALLEAQLKEQAATWSAWAPDEDT